MAKAISCGCRQTACKGAVTQDEIYGKGMRLHNATIAGWRCTICSNLVVVRNAFTGLKIKEDDAQETVT